MIVSFSCAKTHSLFESGKSRHWNDVLAVALRKLDQIDGATALDDLRSPPGNRLEPLKGSRAGQHSIRINRQWRVCFVWQADGAHHVEIPDYH